MGVRLFQFIIAHLSADEIVDIPFLLPLSKRLGRPGKPLHPGTQRLLVFPDASLVKEILGTELYPQCVRMDPTRKVGDVENLRTIQAQIKQHLT